MCSLRMHTTMPTEGHSQHRPAQAYDSQRQPIIANKGHSQHRPALRQPTQASTGLQHHADRWWPTTANAGPQKPTVCNPLFLCVSFNFISYFLWFLWFLFMFPLYLCFPFIFLWIFYFLLFFQQYKPRYFIKKHKQLYYSVQPSLAQPSPSPSSVGFSLASLQLTLV